jgi:hypothetical protein
MQHVCSLHKQRISKNNTFSSTYLVKTLLPTAKPVTVITAVVGLAPGFAKATF